MKKHVEDVSTLTGLKNENAIGWVKWKDGGSVTTAMKKLVLPLPSFSPNNILNIRLLLLLLLMSLLNHGGWNPIFH